MATILSSKKSGSKSRVVISGLTENDLANVDLFCISNDDGTITVCTNNKRELAQINALVSATNLPQREQRGETRRYVELLANAEMRGLSHGKSWACSGYHVDANSLPPEWEGEQICYVYE